MGLASRFRHLHRGRNLAIDKRQPERPGVAKKQSEMTAAGSRLEELFEFLGHEIEVLPLLVGDAEKEVAGLLAVALLRHAAV